jgi:hypothetical protein
VDWARNYERIIRDFGYSRDEDEEAAAELATMIPSRSARLTMGRVAAIIEGRQVVVTGGALTSARALAISRTLRRVRRKPRLVCAGDTCALFLARKTVPDIVVSDLDGRVEPQMEAWRRGSILVVHAHGDNRARLPLVRRRLGRVLGTCQSRPPRNLVNLGGFTDGDRAVILALAAGAEQVVLEGFDFARPRPRTRAKAMKLRWARRLIAQADDGRVVWPAASPPLRRRARPPGSHRTPPRRATS